MTIPNRAGEQAKPCSLTPGCCEWLCSAVILHFWNLSARILLEKQQQCLKLSDNTFFPVVFFNLERALIAPLSINGCFHLAEEQPLDTGAHFFFWFWWKLLCWSASETIEISLQSLLRFFSSARNEKKSYKLKNYASHLIRSFTLLDHITVIIKIPHKTPVSGLIKIFFSYTIPTNYWSKLYNCSVISPSPHNIVRRNK